MAELLTTFGEQVEQAMIYREISKHIKKETLTEGILKNKLRVEKARKIISNSQKTVVVGPGPVEQKHINLLIELQKYKEVVSIFSHWSNFRDGVKPQIIASAHVHLLMASLVSNNTPDFMIHGVYTTCPPALSKSVTITWCDPYLKMDEQDVNVDQLIRHNIMNLASDNPSMYIPRNSLFFCLFNAIFMGSKQISLVGFDPDRPEYFFSKDEEKKLEIAKCLLQSNPRIAAWDGRFERIKNKRIDHEHSLLKLVSQTLDPTLKSASGSGWRSKEMERAMKLVIDICTKLGVKLNYFGESMFLERCGLKRVA